MESRVATDVAYISALSALAGSVIGGLASGLTTWLNRHAEARANWLARDISRRQDLYRDFIISASKAYGEAIVSDQPQIQELVDLYGLISRMRVLSRPKTIECADKVLVATIDTYFLPNKSFSELNEVLKKGTVINLLKGIQRSCPRGIARPYADLNMPLSLAGRQASLGRSINFMRANRKRTLMHLIILGKIFASVREGVYYK